MYKGTGVHPDHSSVCACLCASVGVDRGKGKDRSCASPSAISELKIKLVDVFQCVVRCVALSCCVNGNINLGLCVIACCTLTSGFCFSDLTYK